MVACSNHANRHTPQACANIGKKILTTGALFIWSFSGISAVFSFQGVSANPKAKAGQKAKAQLPG